MENHIAKTTHVSKNGFQYIDCSTPGQKVGSYIFIGDLGKGAFSTVYDVVDSEGIRHAAKVFRDEERFVICAKREKSILQGLTDCSHIISCTDTFLLNSSVVLVLDKAITDLYSYQQDFHRDGYSVDCPTPMYSVADLAIALLRGLSALVAHGIIHCDIKPENILLKKYEGGIRAVIADLGSACSGIRTTGDGLIASPWYRPPEVYGKGIMSHPGDLWSVGCVLFEYAFGEALFDVTLNRHTVAEEVARLFAGHIVFLGEPPQEYIDRDSPIVRHLGYPPAPPDSGSLTEKIDILVLRMRDIMKYTDLHVILSSIFVWDATLRVSIIDALATVQTWDISSSVPDPAVTPPLRSKLIST